MGDPMIFRPCLGQRARLHYRASMRQGTLELPAAPEGMTGTVVCCGRGPGAHNALVSTERGLIVVPKGNLVEV